MKRLILSTVLALALLSGVFVSACAPEEEEVVKFGVITFLTGPGAQWGNQQYTEYQLWVDDVNNAGGLKVGNKRYRVELVAFDARGDPVLAVDGANKLFLQDKVIVCGLNVYMDKPVLPLATEHKIITWAQRLESLLRPEWPYLFAYTPDARENYPPVFRYLSETFPELKTIAHIASDDDNARATYDASVPMYAQLGFELIDTRWYPHGTTDFYPIVSPAFAKQPDIIDLGGAYPEAAAGTVKAARELGFTGPFTHVGMMTKVLVDIAGIEKSEDIYFASGWEHEELWEGASQRERDHYDRYLAKFGNEDYLAHVYYNDFFITQQAIEIAQSLDPDKIVEALHTNEFQALAWKGKFYGKPRYGVANQFPTPIWVSRVTGGEVHTIAMVPPLAELPA